jgi:hypothetical protein
VLALAAQETPCRPALSSRCQQVLRSALALLSVLYSHASHYGTAQADDQFVGVRGVLALLLAALEVLLA